MICNRFSTNAVGRLVTCVVIGTLAGCGAAESGGSTTEPGSGDLRVPPEDPGTAITDSSARIVLGMSQLFLGDKNPMGVPDADAWMQYGWDLDGLDSRPEDVDRHCRPLSDASADRVIRDGEGGVDNSFGLNVMPILTVVEPNASALANESIQTGEFTLLFDHTNLGSAPTESGLRTVLLSAAPLPIDARPPKFDGSDTWPVSPELLVDGDIDRPTVVFDDAYKVDGVWVSGREVGLKVKLVLTDVVLNLDIQSAIVTMELYGQPPMARRGIIAGVMETEAFVRELRGVLGSWDPDACADATFDSIATLVRGMSDIRADGTNGDPSLPCNAISIGLGFEASPAQLGMVAEANPSPPDPCAP